MSTHVPFITVERGDDLIVSFGLGQYAAQSLTLLRTPKFESLLPDEKRGVTVGSGASEHELLIRVHWHDQAVQITSTSKQYELDLSAVDATELKEAKAILRKMNFDNRFEIQGT